MKKLLFTLLFALPLTLFASEIEVYHGLQGFLEVKFHELVSRFEEQSGHVVNLHSFDNYNSVIDEGLKKRPHLMFGYEVAAATLIDHEDLIPVSALGIDKGRYVDSIAAFYSNSKGELVGMPFNISTGVLFYNKAAFKKAGLDPQRPPQTWPEMERALEKLSQAHFAGFTTAWPAAYHVEHLAALHATPLATNNNGFTGRPCLDFGREVIHHHLAQLLSWQRRGLFTYAGQTSVDAERLFTEGRCAIVLQGANRFGLIARAADFEIGVGPLPYWPQYTKEPYTLNTGGAALWVFKDRAEDREAVGEFLAFLSSEESDQWWHETTGYLPVTKAVAHRVTRSENPAARIATQQVFSRPTSPYSVGLRFPGYIPVRIRLMDNIERMLDGELTPEEVTAQTELFAHLPTTGLEPALTEMK